MTNPIHTAVADHADESWDARRAKYVAMAGSFRFRVPRVVEFMSNEAYHPFNALVSLCKAAVADSERVGEDQSGQNYVVQRTKSRGWMPCPSEHTSTSTS